MGFVLLLSGVFSCVCVVLQGFLFGLKCDLWCFGNNDNRSVMLCMFLCCAVDDGCFSDQQA